MVDSVATDDVTIGHQRQQRGHLGDIELSVAIGIEDQVLACGPETGLQGGSVAAIPIVMNDA